MLMINHLGGFYLIALSLYDIIGSTRSRKGMSVIRAGSHFVNEI